MDLSRKYRKRVKLIFNPNAGAQGKSPVQLMDIIKEMQQWKLVCETFIIEKDSDISNMTYDALGRGINMFVICGGDGTVSAVFKALLWKGATLGIIPIGTCNNIALSLGIPKGISDAIAVLRTGRRIKIDVGTAGVNGVCTPFIEVCTIGLISALYNSSDEIQRGRIMRVKDFFSTFNNSEPSEVQMVMDNKDIIKKDGYAALICNMPYFGRNYQVAKQDSFKDGLLDVLFFDRLSKPDLIGYFLKGVKPDTKEDALIFRYRIKSIAVDANPAMLVMADGKPIGEGPVKIGVLPRALNIMAQAKQPKKPVRKGEGVG